MPLHMMDAEETAKYLKVSYWTVLEKAKKGAIPCVRVGNRVLFSQEGLDNWIEQQEAQSIGQGVQADDQYGKLRKI